MSLKPVFKSIFILITAAPLSLLTFKLTSQIHVMIYKAIYPMRNTEWDHNIYFDPQISLHFFIGVPLFYGLFVFLLYKGVKKFSMRK